jgi:inositol transport system ATP-binding protein
MASHGQILRWGVFINETAERAMVEEYRRKLNIRMATPEQLIASLSGGNQQKVILSRWLALRPKVLIVDEPTRGIDIGAKADILKTIRQMADDGIGLIIVSSELEEVVTVCDRVLVMAEGRVVAHLDHSVAPFKVEDILHAVFKVAQE